MQNCPNCGRPTARTVDWACQWCGYPLLSKSYKKIDKTYKQLQEERKQREVVAEDEPILEAEHEAIAEDEPVLEAEPEPVAELEPEGEAVTEVEPVLESEPEPVAELERESVTEGEPVLEAEPVVETEPQARKRRKAKDKRDEVVMGEPLSEAEPKVEEEQEIEAEREPVAQYEPSLTPGVEVMTDLIEIGVEELASAFQADRLSADARFANKVLRITGVVDKVVVMDHLEIRYVMLTGAGKRGVLNVRCTFDKEHSSKLRRLTPRQTVTVQGKYDGYERNILIKCCVLVG